jgi:NNP family nitrate/nitrite transporter-like MFS transporter
MEPALLEKSCPIPEPFRVRAGTVFFIAALFLLNFTGRFIFAPLMPFMEQELGMTHAQAGSLFLIISLGFAGAQFGSGFLSSRLNHKKVIVISVVVVGIALLALGFIHSLPVIRLSLFLLGLGAGLHVPSALATITAMINRQDWGKALGVHSAAPSLSLVLGPLLVAALVGSISWRVIIICLAGLSLFAGMAFMHYGKCGDFPGDAPRPSVLRRIAGLPSLWLMVVLFVMALGGSVGAFTMLPLYLTVERGFDRASANTLLGLAQISGLLAAFLAGWFADRVGPKLAMSILLAAAGMATILLGISSGPWLLFSIFIQPALAGSFFPAGFSAMSRIVQPNLRSVVASVAVPSAFFIGVGVFPALMGYLGQTYSFSLGLALAGSLMLLGPVFASLLKFTEYAQEGC